MSIENLLNNNRVFWMNANEGPESDIVISCRIRLARNLRSMAFPHLLNDELGSTFIEQLQTAVEKCDIKEGLELVTFDGLSAADRQILVEKHLISPVHAQMKDKFRGIVVNHSGSISVMVNEEDHLRIQTIYPGMQFDHGYKIAQEVDDELEKSLDFAFDIRKGYLTSCLTNVGTGMRASVMLHLPAIAMTNQTGRIFGNLGQVGMTIRGLYGEGTEFLGNFFQLSNQITIGQTEEDIINNLVSVTRQIIEQERYLRDKLKRERLYWLEDITGRAYGILANARLITSNEALALLSNLRLGVDLQLVKNIPAAALNELVVAIQPAHLQKGIGQDLDSINRDLKRAEIIKERLISYA